MNRSVPTMTATTEPATPGSAAAAEPGAAAASPTLSASATVSASASASATAAEPGLHRLSARVLAKTSNSFAQNDPRTGGA